MRFILWLVPVQHNLIITIYMPHDLCSSPEHAFILFCFVSFHDSQQSIVFLLIRPTIRRHETIVFSLVHIKTYVSLSDSLWKKPLDFTRRTPIIIGLEHETLVRWLVYQTPGDTSIGYGIEPRDLGPWASVERRDTWDIKWATDDPNQVGTVCEIVVKYKQRW